MKNIIFILGVIIMSMSVLLADSWKYGFYMGENIYFDRSHQTSEKISHFQLKWDLIPKNKNKSDAGMISISKNYLEIIETRRDKPSLGSVGDLKTIELKHKIENNRNYISEDGKKWEELKIGYVKDTGKKNQFDEPLVLVKFECSYFSGVYEIVFYGF